MTHHHPPRRVRDRLTHRVDDALTVALPNLHENPHALAFRMPSAVNASEMPLSIGKLGHGQEGYYAETVAAGVEDYYVGRGEAPGRWLGTMASELGLDGQVEAATLREVLAGRDP